jgi:hypothetical protein
MASQYPAHAGHQQYVRVMLQVLFNVLYLKPRCRKQSHLFIYYWDIYPSSITF